MIERSDFTGLVIGAFIWYLFIQQSNLDMLELVNKCIIAMVCASVYDLIWLCSHYSVSLYYFYYKRDIGMMNMLIKQ